MSRIVLAIALVAVGAAACRDSLDPSDSKVARLELLPRVLELDANGGKGSVLIGGYNADGTYLEPARGVLLFVRDTSVAIGEAPTIVTGRSVGTTYLIAQSYDPAQARDSILVRVGHFRSDP